jgi:predicted esterase
MKIHFIIIALLFIVIGFSYSSNCTAQTKNISKTFNKTIEIQTSLDYLIYLPPNYAKKAAQKWPVLLYLHGAGERGNEINKVKAWGPTKYVETKGDLPFIVISPQCPSNKRWNDEIMQVTLKNLTDQLTQEYRVDQERIYLTGLSMGGYGTWALATQYPDYFAAMAMFCGSGDETLASKISHLPTRIYHGAKDSVVPISESDKLVKALTKHNGYVDYTVYPIKEHVCWSEDYQDRNFYTWFLKHSRTKNINRKKYLGIVKTSELEILNNHLTENIFSLIISNPFTTPLTGTLKWHLPSRQWHIDSINRNFSIPAKTKQSLTNKINYSGKTMNNITPKYTILFNAKSSKTKTDLIGKLELNKTLSCMYMKNPPKLDGQLDDWPQNIKDTGILLNGKNQVNKGNNFWKGPHDLSSSVYIAWNEDHFYLAAEVIDDSFSQSSSDINIWKGDCIQFAFDTLNDTVENKGYDSNDYEYGISFTPKGNQVWCWKAAKDKKSGLIDQVKLSITKAKGKTIYEMSLPRKQLTPLKFENNSKFKFNIIVSDRDVQTPNEHKTIVWRPGIVHSKSPYQFGTMRFIKQK